MADLQYGDKHSLEELFGMSSGYVLAFTDRTFYEFFREVVNVDIHSEKYLAYGSSKARKLRVFWDTEPDHLVGKVLVELIKVAQETATPVTKDLLEKCQNIANKLLVGKINLDHLNQVAIQFNNEYILQQSQRMENALESDDLELVIGTAKELIETCCKTILEKRGASLNGNPEMSDLTKAVFKELKLTQDDVSPGLKGADSFRRIQSNLASLSNEISMLRNYYGTGHGKTADSPALSKRHAKLIASSAAALTVYLFETEAEPTPILESTSRKPLGQWLVDNVPHGTNLEPPIRDDYGRPNPFLEEDDR